jgi:hypothetical protein
MAKALITIPGGIQMKIEGTPQEISSVIENVRKQAHSGKESAPANEKTGRKLLVDLLASLLNGDFFKKPRNLADVKDALGQMGYHYPTTTLSTVMLRSVRNHRLRRIQLKNHWHYTR